MNSMKDSVSGVIESVIYQSPDGNYTVCELEDDNGDPVTVVGSMPMASEGIHIRAYGEWGNHPTYGRQFRCEYFEQDMPDSEGDILRYLSAGNIKGIGPRTALKIVERDGTETFDVIENHPDWLSEISGISKRKAAEIGESFRESSGARAVIMYCRNICSPAVSMKIYKKWGSSAVERIKENPYSLCNAVNGIGFRKADELAKTIGIPQDSDDRIHAGLLYILDQEARRCGHTCLPADLLQSYGADLLCVSPERVNEVMVNMLGNGKLQGETDNDKTYVYSPRYFKAENNIARKLSQLARMCPAINRDDVGEFIAQLEMKTGISYAMMQKNAIAAALEHGVMILTGGPGTGKTTVTKALLSIFDSMGMECALAAPTGRAANKMSEATSHEAKTLHRLLETGFSADSDEDNVFIRDENNLLEEDVFIVDEVSMIDTFLMESFLKAVKPGARVIFIGDSDQLPSVGAGNILSDLITSGCFCTVRLTEIHRQADSSLIVKNAHAVNRGESPESGGIDSDFFILRRQSDADVSATVTDLCLRRLPAAYGDDITDKIQIISPSKKGAAGTEEICRIMQTVMNPGDGIKSEIVRGTTVFREGDKVMQVRNNYSVGWTKGTVEGTGVFNGDIGVIESVDTSAGEVMVNFDGRIATYDVTELDELELSYAITVHKSQGSEYPVVVIPVYGCAPMLLNRCLLYTAITRASKMCIIVARGDCLDRMVQNDSHASRCTGLVRYIMKYSGNY